MSTASILRAPFPYFGGKSRAASLVWQRFGSPVNYVEPFFGSGAVLLSCPEGQRPRVETVNDANALLCNFWRATKADPEGVAAVADYPVIETDLHARHRWLLSQVTDLRARLDADPDAFDVKAAAWWVWGASAWIGSGWCEEGNAETSKLPELGNGVTGSGGPAIKAGKGIHAAGMREPSRQLPDFGGNVANGTHNPGRGIHAAGARAPSRQLPALTPEGGPTGINAQERRTALYDIFARLSERLRYVRVACGDWARICTPAVTYRHGLTAVFLDPPYPGHGHVYGTGEDIAPAVRAWALDMGKRPDMRIAFCHYEGTAPELVAAGWEVVAWKAKGGYSNQREDGENENAKLERIAFSPACLRPGVDAGQLDWTAQLRGGQ